MCILKLKLLRLSAGIWCLLQLPVVHTDLFGLADVTVGGVLVIALIHSNFDRRFTPLHSPSVRSRCGMEWMVLEVGQACERALTS
ncbi:hypothetical protein CHARACLAT_008765 [Characodon lateralis]|uniref:Secreted protein n=1 Tax=Characodon lateralis TaxID=208331 RepID=A0ABU7F3V5_9TELE|nr:hypothetical protein [Characodon lateralis]